MTEAEWLASDDPAAMLRYLQEGCGVCDGTGSLGGSESPKRPCERCGGRQPAKPSERKLRLFACACRRHVPGMEWSGQSQGWRDMEEFPERKTLANGVGPHEVVAMEQAELFVGDRLASDVKPSPRVAAHLLRDIVGTPHRPYHVRWAGGLIPSLAQAAYEERDPGRPHKKCRCGRNFARLQKKGLSPPLAWCNHCAEDGGWWADAVARESDGTLDPVRLAVLADALEEAGCPQEVEGACPACLGSGSVPKPKGSAYQSTALPCPACGGSGVGAHPALAHLRSPGPHVRGCWAIDLITGRE